MALAATWRAGASSMLLPEEGTVTLYQAAYLDRLTAGRGVSGVEGRGRPGLPMQTGGGGGLPAAATCLQQDAAPACSSRSRVAGVLPACAAAWAKCST